MALKLQPVLIGKLLVSALVMPASRIAGRSYYRSSEAGGMALTLLLELGLLLGGSEMGAIVRWSQQN